jgi:hypothetical protein
MKEINMKKILGLLLGLTAASAFADNGLYVGVGAGLGWNDIASPAMAFRLDGGYQITPGFAIEVGTTGITQSGGVVNENVQMYDLSAKGILPLGDMFDIFGQIGGAYQTPGVATYNTGAASYAASNGCLVGGGCPAQQAGWQMLVGGGFDINLTKSVAFNVTDLYYFGSNNALGNSNALLAGMKFAF